MKVNFTPIKKATKTQPMWLIEEKVIILRTRTWTTPRNLPTRTEEITLKKIRSLFKSKKSCDNRIQRGFSFWMVNRKNKTNQLSDSTILGTQAWKGAAPNFTSKAITNRKVKGWSTWPEIGETTKLKRKSTEAKAWVRKYLIEESLKPLEFSLSKRGMKAKVLISNPTQHKINEEEEITNTNLNKIIKRNKKIEGENKIREEIESIVGAWAQKLNLAYLSI